MIRTPWLALGAALALSACGRPDAGDNDFAQTWLVFFETLNAAGASGNITENYDVGEPYEGGDDDGQQSSSSADRSPEVVELFLAQLQNDEWVAYYGCEVLRGTFEDGQWEFAASSFEETTNTTTYESLGYRYERVERDTTTIEITMEVTDTDGVAEGEFSSVDRTTLTFTESDRWDESFDFRTSGQTPASSYLDFNFETPNRYDESDCEGDDCELEISTSVPTTGTFEAVRTETIADDLEAVLANCE